MLPLDLAVFHAVNADAGTLPVVVASARWISQWLPGLMGAALAVLLAQGSSRQRQAVLLCLAAMLLAWLGVHGLRWWVPSPRPAQLGLGLQWIGHSANAGFPSMHAAGAFALAGALSVARRRRLAWVGWTSALLIAWSRVCLGVHFPSDVLAGALTGLAGAVAAAGFGAGVRRALELNWRGRFSAYCCRREPPWARRR